MRDVSLSMPRKMIWLNQGQFRGWACSDCGWKFNPSDPLVGTSIDEMKQRYEGQRDREFKSHICAEYPREERIKDV
jgi:hypothetical protein